MPAVSYEYPLLMIGIIIIFVMILYSSKKSGFTFNNSEYQYSNPNTYKEWDYYTCMKDECKGDTHDYDCLEKCHLKSYRRGMMTMDTKDWICMPYAKDENAFYKCLDSVYSDYRSL